MKNPEITYQIFEKNTFELIELLEKNIIEIAILRSPFPDSSSFHAEIITKERMIAVARPEFFDQNEADFDIANLSDKPVILYRRWESLLKNYFKSKNVSPKYVCINDDARTSLSWAEEGMGIAILPPSAIYNIESNSIICKDIRQDEMDTAIAIAWKESKYVSRALENFIDAALSFNNY